MFMQVLDTSICVVACSLTCREQPVREPATNQLGSDFSVIAAGIMTATVLDGTTVRP